MANNTRAISAARVRDTTLLMTVAALLVANSHLENFYPRPWLAGDGLLGNSLFFLLAGYGLVRSERVKPRPFLQWFSRRMVRLYPTLLLVMAVFALGIGQEWRVWDGPLRYVQELVWPTRFTFVMMVVPFYLLFFVLMKAGSARVFPISIALLVIPYGFAYVHDLPLVIPGQGLRLGRLPALVHAGPYLQVMLLGGWLAFREDPARDRLLPWTITLWAATVAYLWSKVIMVTGHWERAYPVLHALTFLLCLSLFKVLTATAVVAAVRRSRILEGSVALIGGLTLEIYLVHTFIAEYRWIWKLPLPLNLAVFWALTLPLSYAVGVIARAMQRRLRGEGESARTSRVEEPPQAVLLSPPSGGGQAGDPVL